MHRDRGRAVEAHGEPRESARQPHGALEHAVRHALETGDRVVGQVVQHARSVEGAARRQPQGDRGAVVGCGRGIRRRTVPRADREPPAACQPSQLGRGGLVDARDGLVELPDAREPGRERDVGDREVGRREQGARGLGAVGAREGERTSAELVREHAGQVPRRVAEP